MSLLKHRIYSLSTRQKAAQAYKELMASGSTVALGVSISSVKRLLAMLDIKNESTIRYWASVDDWRKQSVKNRLGQRGRKGELNEEETEQLKECVKCYLFFKF